jgi:hypothetical protein
MEWECLLGIALFLKNKIVVSGTAMQVVTIRRT